MKYFHVDKDIEQDIFNNLLEFLNNNEDEEKTLILNSNGGSNHFGRIVLNIINSNADKFTLISAKVYSTAFYIFYSAKCKKKIISNTIGCFHHAYLSNVDLDATTKKAVWSEQQVLMDNLKNREESITDLSFMTKAELNKFNRSKDVYFNFKRMKEIFPNAEII